jgi:hypothetical protein
MNYHRSLDQEDSVNFMFSDTSVVKYAWLEHEKGMWHLLTDLFAAPEDSTRKWPDRQHAIDELTQEGWSIVSAYPESLSIPRSAGNGTCGYGLIWVGH